MNAGGETPNGQKMVSKITTDDLGKKKLCLRFIPGALTIEQWENWMTSRHDLEMSNNDPEFSN